MVDNCLHRTARWYDMKKHLRASKAHSFSEEQAEELIRESKLNEIEDEEEDIGATGSETSNEDYCESDTDSDSDEG